MSCIGAALWVLGCVLRFQHNLFVFTQTFRGYGADEGALALKVVVITSVLYSILRIVDLRREMALRKQAEAAADWIATHDQLTRLPNRYAFERAAVPMSDGTGAGQSKVTVFSIDLDGFKKVNDFLGHAGGDVLLCEVARRLGSLASASSVYRFGGDEFIVIATGLKPSQEQAFAGLIIDALTRPVVIADFAAEVGASVGYARLPDHGRTLEQVVNCSDIAMYEAKSGGRNSFAVFSKDMQERVSARARFEARLRAAIAGGMIEPHYQPLIDLSTGRICGFEALARWTDEDGDRISPETFIAVAEETGLITDLFKQLLGQACRDARAWPPEITLSFNISPLQMEDKLLASRILKILATADLAPSRLEIEITENALIRDPKLAAAIIEELHQAGVHVALDDFGTGYSSLSQLARYKFDKIKIDKSFVATYGGDERQEKIVRAMLGLGRSLNIEMTAEGIEEYSQLSYLLSQGCDIGQGYLFGKAMPAAAALQFVIDRNVILSATG